MEKSSNQIQVDVDDDTARGTYANLALIAHSETEFLLDFIFMQPNAPKAKVLSRIISSPVHAKRFLWALQDNIDKYEASFGTIQAGEGPGHDEPAAGLYQ